MSPTTNTIVTMLDTIHQTITDIRRDDLLTPAQLTRTALLAADDYALLSQSATSVKVAVGGGAMEETITLVFDNEGILPYKEEKPCEWDEFSFAALLLCREHAAWREPTLPGRKYTREGMIRRVMSERREKALQAKYKVRLADNIYGEHLITNEKGRTARVTLWDFEAETGYIDNIDWRTNKLGTTKHIMYLFQYLKDRPRIFKKLKKKYPFVDISLDPLNEYRISWRYPHKLKASTERLIRKYFGSKTYIDNEKIAQFWRFIQEARDIDSIVIRPEVLDKIDRYFGNKTAQDMYDGAELDYSVIKVELYPYQKQGVQFVVPKAGAIIADEMGLGKTLQAICISVLKKQVFGFSKTLVICPASIKHQWKTEIEKFTDERAMVVEGFPEVRAEMYQMDGDIFIINYETVLRDLRAINEADFDLVILDEAQKIKNFKTKTAVAIKNIRKQHGLVITGTPIENKLVDLYSISQFVDPHLFAPLWEFSYQHCLFDPSSKNRITGYYNLAALKERLASVLLRREKRKVIDQLPNISEKNVYVHLHEEQELIHASATRGVAKILQKKFKTNYDWQKLMHLLTTMRMACDSTYLVDKKSNYSSKLVELEDILINQLDLLNNNRKTIVFSEWIGMHHLIGEMLKEIGLGFVMLTGKVAVKKRGRLIREFEENDDCRIFLSTESGGSGLNLQMADIVINFELPWNPARKSQRIGRIDRLGQVSNKLTVINLVSIDSIESKIAAGLLLKQNLFDGVLSAEKDIDTVDFSAEGRAQFIQQLEEVIDDLQLQRFEDPEQMAEWDLEEPEPELVSEYGQDETGGSAMPTSATEENEEKFEELEQILNKGMDFLAGIYKMTSGQELHGDNDQSISVDRKTGEVTMKFKVRF